MLIVTLKEHIKGETMPYKDTDYEYQWSQEECEKLVGHCWEYINMAYGDKPKQCRHCGRKEKHIWVEDK